MLKQRHRFFLSVLVAADVCILIAGVPIAYLARFEWFRDTFPVSESSWSMGTHALPFLAVIPIMLATMMWSGLYTPRRDHRFYKEAGVLLRSIIVGLVVIVAFTAFFRNQLFQGRDFSRVQMLFYGLFTAGALMTWRMIFRSTVRWMRRRGWNQRCVAVIGTGRLGQVVVHTLRRNSWTGISPMFYISHHPVTARRCCLSLPVHGGLNDLESILDATDVSGVFLALPGRMAAQMPDLLHRLSRYSVDVRVVPDINPRHLPMNMSVNELEGMPILSIRESPLSTGWGPITKRVVDVLGSFVALIIFAIPMAVIALLIRLTSPGPVIYLQERMSLNGQRFKILKFRTMRVSDPERQAAEDAGRGADAWTQRDDPRVTPVGSVLRSLSLDELPQLFNVLLGDMSLVGPRPERPELVQQFREDWRGYILRQNVKAGMTGWAQVNGLRGNTDLKKRLQYDIFYVRNWSFMFDVRILWMTVFHGFAHPNAH